jgi:hypothetical protein
MGNVPLVAKTPISGTRSTSGKVVPIVRLAGTYLDPEREAGSCNGRYANRQVARTAWLVP